MVSGSGFPRLAFHRVPEGKTAKNRLHIDLIASDYDADLDRLLALGASKVNEMTPGGARWTTLVDPEGTSSTSSQAEPSTRVSAPQHHATRSSLTRRRR